MGNVEQRAVEAVGVLYDHTPDRNQNHQNQTPELDLHVWVNCSFKRVCSVTQEILKFEPSTFKYSDLKK